MLEQPAQVGEAAPDVLFRVEGVADAEALGRIGDQLHEAEGVLGGTRRRVEIGFGTHDGQRQTRIDAEARCQLLDHLGMTALVHRQRPNEAIHHIVGHRLPTIHDQYLRRLAGDEAIGQFLGSSQGADEALGLLMPPLGSNRQQRCAHLAVPGNALPQQVQAPQAILPLDAAIPRRSTVMGCRHTRLPTGLGPVAALQEARQGRRLIAPLGRLQGRRIPSGSLNTNGQQGQQGGKGTATGSWQAGSDHEIPDEMQSEPASCPPPRSMAVTDSPLAALNMRGTQASRRLCDEFHISRHVPPAKPNAR